MTTTENNNRTKTTESTKTVCENIGINPLTAKRITLAVGSIGFAICFSGLLWGTMAFAYGFLIMLISAFVYTNVTNSS